MSSGRAKANFALGFITVVEDTQNGLFGGYLVLNATGRPLEFHCTAPIKPNRAQQILYGPTLAPYLFGEQIGHTLVAKGKTRPQLLCTDREPALAVREFVDVPVALVLSPDDASSQPSRQPNRQAQSSTQTQPDTWRLDATHPGVPGLIAFRHGSNRLAVPEPDAGDLGSLTDRLGQLSGAFDLAEPFDRIRQAIEEARQGGR